MGEKLFINEEPCTSCLNCMAVCAQRRAGEADPNAAAIRVVDRPFTGRHVIMVCVQCRPAPCAEQCPAGAIFLPPGASAWTIDRERCIRCGTCVQACPFGAMFWWDDDHGPVKCDLCGGVPACVEACHFGVLRFGPDTDQELARKGIPPEDLDPLLGRGADA